MEEIRQCTIQQMKGSSFLDVLRCSEDREPTYIAPIYLRHRTGETLETRNATLSPSNEISLRLRD